MIFLYLKVQMLSVKSVSCPVMSSTLCDPMDCSLSGSPIHGILQARILEWVTIPFSRGSSRPGIEPGSPALQADSLPLSHQGIKRIKSQIHQAITHGETLHFLLSTINKKDPHQCPSSRNSVTPRGKRSCKLTEGKTQIP